MTTETQLSLLADTHASHFPLPGSEEARKTTVISGQKCSALLNKRDPLGWLLKTLLVISPWDSTRCYLTWKAKGTPQGRLLFQLAPSMPRTDEIECGLLPTPRAAMTGAATPERVNDKNRNLETAVAREMYPTPSASMMTGADMVQAQYAGNDPDRPSYEDAKMMFATPQSRDHFPAHTKEYIEAKKAQGHGMGNLNDQVGGHLNPEFVSYLMGYPKNWTKVE